MYVYLFTILFTRWYFSFLRLRVHIWLSIRDKLFNTYPFYYLLQKHWKMKTLHPHQTISGHINVFTHHLKPIFIMHMFRIIKNIYKRYSNNCIYYQLYWGSAQWRTRAAGHPAISNFYRTTLSQTYLICLLN